MNDWSTDTEEATDEATDRAMAHIDDVAERMVQHVITYKEGVDELTSAGMDAHDASAFLLHVKGTMNRK